MSSNEKPKSSDDSVVRKPKLDEVVLSSSLSKPTGKSNGCSGLKNGDPNLNDVGGEAGFSSSDLTKSTGVNSVSQDLSIGAPIAKKINGPTIPSKKTGLSSGDMCKSAVNSGVRGKASVSSGVRGKNIVSDSGGEVVCFRDVTFGPNEGELRFRLIHFWEARNTQTKTLIGLEMLLIDQEGTVIQGFIPPGRMKTYLQFMKAGAIYRLNNYFGSKNKTLYRVADPTVTISFTWNSVLSPLEDSLVRFPDDRFRFHGYEEFEAACDLRGDLYDYVGHIKLINGQALNGSRVFDEADNISTRRVLLHVQTHDDPVMKLYLWDDVASNFIDKFKLSGGTARVIVVTALNPKRLGGVLSLSSMTPSRVFLDNDVQVTRDYLTWLNSNMAVANRINADVVTKTELVTIGDLLAYMKQPSAKVAWFECFATIDDVVHGSGWYYIGCGGCHTKATKGPTTLMCKKCGKSEIVGVAQYLAKISVYDNSDQAVFVVLGDAGEELTGKKASMLVESYFENNDLVGAEDIVPVPQVLIDTIGQRRKFVVKVSDHNLSGKTQTLTVTKVLPLDAVKPVLSVEENLTAQHVQETLANGVVDADPSTSTEASGGERKKRVVDMAETEQPKRTKCG